MADNTKIEWADASWNPVFGCSKVSPGCSHCYAEAFALTRMKGKREYTGLPWTPENADANVQLRPERLDQPLRWKRPRRIFVNSLSDLFHELVPDAFIDQVFAVMALAPQHTFQVLTKRPERMYAYLTDWTTVGRVTERIVARKGPGFEGWSFRLGEWPLPNVWLGTSVENARWRTRIDELRHTPAAVRFLSCEPLLGPLASPVRAFRIDDDADRIERQPDALDLTGIHWVIVGGESGPGARPMDLAWVRAIIDECREQGVAPFVKQLGTVWAVEHGHGRTHGGDPEQWPEDLRVREYPT